MCIRCIFDESTPSFPDPVWQSTQDFKEMLSIVQGVPEISEQVNPTTLQKKVILAKYVFSWKIRWQLATQIQNFHFENATYL